MCIRDRCRTASLGKGSVSCAKRAFMLTRGCPSWTQWGGNGGGSWPCNEAVRPRRSKCRGARGVPC
eukprot:817348-Heterocapsa_arctica.AAC.1